MWRLDSTLLATQGVSFKDAKRNQLLYELFKPLDSLII
jgi:hypothetical protein